MLSNSTEKFNPQGIMRVKIEREGKGKRFICTQSYAERSGKASLVTKNTYRQQSLDQVNILALLATVKQMHRLKNEKIEIFFPDSKSIKRLASDLERGRSSNSEIEEIIQLLADFRFYKFSAMEG